MDPWCMEVMRGAACMPWIRTGWVKRLQTPRRERESRVVPYVGEVVREGVWSHIRDSCMLQPAACRLWGTKGLVCLAMAYIYEEEIRV